MVRNLTIGQSAIYHKPEADQAQMNGRSYFESRILLDQRLEFLGETARLKNAINKIPPSTKNLVEGIRAKATFEGQYR